jgi:hypothetical protein
LGFAAKGSRIKLSRGTRPHVQILDRGSLYYSSNARVPRGPWRRPFGDEFELLSAGPHRWPNVVATIIPQVSNRTRTLLLREARRQCVGHKAEKVEIIKEWSREVWEPFAENSSSVRCLGFAIRDPGQLTTTVDQRICKRTGLHVDSWFKAKADERNLAANRLCLNLGSSSRSLLFINLPLTRIVRMLKRRGLATPLDSPSQVGRHFMRLFPDYSVVSLDVRPWEAYLAPTENIIHDGSTKGQRTLDITVTFLGQFRAFGDPSRMLHRKNGVDI